jgi:hypothetical protein
MTHDKFFNNQLPSVILLVNVFFFFTELVFNIDGVLCRFYGK